MLLKVISALGLASALANPLPPSSVWTPYSDFLPMTYGVNPYSNLEMGSFHVEQIRNTGVWFWTNNAHQAMFIPPAQGKKGGVVLFDCPDPAVYEGIRSVTDAPISTFVYSHSHLDHTKCANMTGLNVAFYSHEATAHELNAYQDPGRPVPSIQNVVKKSMKITLQTGAGPVVLEDGGSAHTDGDLMITVKNHGIIMLIDVVFAQHVPWRNFAITQNIWKFHAVHDRLLADTTWTELVSGHLGRIASRTDVENGRAYALDVRAKALELYQGPEFMNSFYMAYGHIVMSGPNAPNFPPNLFALYNYVMHRLADMCAEYIVPKWAPLMAGIDVFARENCFFYIQSAQAEEQSEAPIFERMYGAIKKKQEEMKEEKN